MISPFDGFVLLKHDGDAWTKACDGCECFDSSSFFFFYYFLDFWFCYLVFRMLLYLFMLLILLWVVFVVWMLLNLKLKHEA